MSEVAIIGVGIHPFGRFENKTYIDIGLEAVSMALEDAGVLWRDIQIALCSALRLPATWGHNVLRNLGMTGLTIVDVECACASGGAAIKFAWQAIEAGECDMALALGVEKMPRGFIDLTDMCEPWQNLMGLTVGPMYWAMSARRHMKDYGTTAEQIAKVAVKSHKNSVFNTHAMYQKEFALEEIMNSRLVCDPLTLLEICAPNEGAVAIVVCSKKVASKYKSKPIFVAGCSLRTSLYPFDRSPAYVLSARGKSVTETTMASREAYQQAGIGPQDLDLVELQDTCAFNEILYSEELGFCKPGEGGRLIDEGATEIGGRIPIGVSGGILSKGEPVGASHLGQVAEIVWQLRGEAGKRQLPDPKVGLAHVIGVGGNCAVTILKS